MDCEAEVRKGIPIEDAIELESAYGAKRQCLTFGNKFVRIIPKNKRVIDIPTKNPVTTDGVYVFLFDQDGRFWVTPVENMFEYGSIHFTLVFESNAKRILTAGELYKTGTKMAFNLLSGSYMKGWMEEMDCDDVIIQRTKSMLEKTHPDLDINYTNKTFVTSTRIPLTENQLKKYHTAGFEIRLYSDQSVCMYEPVMLRAYIAATPNPETKKKFEEQLQRVETEFTLYSPNSGGRKMTRKYCKKTSCKKMGFTQKASCRRWKNCYKNKK